MPLAAVVLLVAAATGALQAVGAVTAVLITALGAYFVARRTTSGSIRTSDAATLWSAAERIREEQGLEIGRLRERVAVLEAALRTEIGKREELEHEVAQLRGAVGD